jgi:NAD(P)-dependent dehydrogenase (short-subunit alcohol dehydrogenase family)
MILKNKNAVIYGGAGAIGGAVARVFAREGARVFIAGRTQLSSTLKRLTSLRRAELSKLHKLTPSMSGRSKSMPMQLRRKLVASTSPSTQ